VSAEIVDLHSHVLPGVDDGARDLAEALSALKALQEQGVQKVIATPHFRASLLERRSRADARLALFDEAYDELTEALAESDLEIALGRACEFKLDAPVADLSDPRLRLEGGPAVLVEFGSFQLPPFAGNQLKAVVDAGWLPVLAHPERYFGIETAFDRVARWVADGTALQVNARSLAGGYGSAPRQIAAELLARGWVTCVASDYHAMGVPEWPPALTLLQSAVAPVSSAGDEPVESGEEWIRQLVSENPRRLISGEPGKPVEGRSVDLGVAGSSRGRRRR